MRTRHIRKRKRYSDPWERYGADGPTGDKNRIAPDAYADMKRLQDVIFDLFDTYGKDVALEMVEFATQGFGVSHDKRFRDESIVRRLLLMPGDNSRARLAGIMAAEHQEEGTGSTDPKTVKRQINDALNTMRRYQEETGLFLIFGMYGPKKLYRKLGITYWA